MKAVCLDGDLQLREAMEVPTPQDDEALVRVHLAGICNTDLELAKGYMEFVGIPGHEFVGTVVSCTAEPRWEGHRVVGEINASCGTCTTCLAGRPTHCPHRTTLGITGRNGAFAEYLTIPACNLHRVPESLPDEVAVFTEPLAAACEILEQIHVHPTDRVIILGDGKLGLLCAQVLALTGADVAALGHHSRNLDILADQGIAAFDDPSLLRGTADLVVEATGNPDGYALARQLVRPRGTIILKSTYHGPVDANLTTAVVDEILLAGSRCGPFAPALRLLELGLVQVLPLIDARYPLDQALTAIEYASRPGTLKVLLTCVQTPPCAPADAR
jgi:alcohol dehydrogenase